MEGGYMRRFFAGPTYEVGKSGSVARKRLAGRHALIYGCYLHLGSNRAIVKSGKINGFIRLGAFWEYPYHGYSLIHPSLILGISHIHTKMKNILIQFISITFMFSWLYSRRRGGYPSQ